jgi:hypothetical protein
MRPAIGDNLSQFFDTWRIMMLTDDDLRNRWQEELQIASPLGWVVASVAFHDAQIENSAQSLL